MNLYPAQVLLLARAPLVLRLGFGRIAASDSVVGAEPLTATFYYEGGQAVARSGEASEADLRGRDVLEVLIVQPVLDLLLGAVGSNRVLPL